MKNSFPNQMQSIAEQDFILKGIDQNVRLDGRNRMDKRELYLETGLINQASGSCRVKVVNGSEVLVGVKVQVGDMDEAKDVETLEDDNLFVPTSGGRVECFVEW